MEKGDDILYFRLSGFCSLLWTGNHSIGRMFHLLSGGENAGQEQREVRQSAVIRAGFGAMLDFYFAARCVRGVVPLRGTTASRTTSQGGVRPPLHPLGQRLMVCITGRGFRARLHPRAVDLRQRSAGLSLWIGWRNSGMPVLHVGFDVRAMVYAEDAPKRERDVHRNSFWPDQ
jgi:hypothetical protein